MKPNLPFANGRLRPASATDLDTLTHLLHQPGVRRFLCDDTLLPRETVADILSRSDAQDAKGLGLWIIENQDGRFVGCAGLEPVSEAAKVSPWMTGGIEPLVAVDQSHWGKGWASAALNALVTYARDPLDLPRLVGAVDCPNLSSHKMMQRCGFVEIGTAPGPAQELVLYEQHLDQ